MSREPGEGAPLRVLGLGGSVRPGSRSQTALTAALAGAAAAGAQTQLWSVGADPLPFYQPDQPNDAAAERFLKTVRQCDALLVSTPAYHGTVSAPVKNLLDHLDALRADTRPYLTGKVVGVIAVGDGTVAAVQAAATLVQAAHALRAFVVPLQVVVTAAADAIPGDRVVSAALAARLANLGHLVTATADRLRAS